MRTWLLGLFLAACTQAPSTLPSTPAKQRAPSLCKKTDQRRCIAGTVTRGGAPVAGATVVVGPSLFGDGVNLQTKFGGPPAARGALTATTNSQGQFVIYGARNGALTIAADHEQHGRSTSVMLAKTNQSIGNIALPLKGIGTLCGKFTLDDNPMEKAIINVQSLRAPSAMFAVQTDENGSFCVDRLAPDRYRVSAMSGSFMRGMTTYQADVAIRSGKTTRAVIYRAKTALSVSIELAPQGEVSFVQAFIMEGTQRARNTYELILLGRRAPGRHRIGGWYMSYHGTQITLDGFPSGQYTVCLLAVPKQVSLREMQAYVDQRGDDYPVSCQPLAIAATPAEQTKQLTFPVPPQEPIN